MALVQFVVVLFQTPPPPLMTPFGVVRAPLKYCCARAELIVAPIAAKAAINAKIVYLK